MLRIELPEKGIKTSKAERRFMDVMKKATRVAAVTEEDVEGRIWKKMIRCDDSCLEMSNEGHNYPMTEKVGGK